MENTTPIKGLLVLGGLGYIGQVLYDEAVKIGLPIFVVDNDMLGFTKSQDNLIKEFEHVDVRDAAALDIVFKKYNDKISHVVNLAAVVGDPACSINPKKAMQINVHAIKNVVDAANKYNKQIIHASTCSLYGSPSSNSGTPEIPFNEDSVIWPIDFYGLTKKEQEAYVVANAIIKPVVFRFGTAYGESPRMRYDLVVNIFSAQASKGQQLNVYGGTAYRPFVHIRDIARAIIHAVTNETFAPGIYNLTNQNVQIQWVAEYLQTKTQCPVNIIKSVNDPRNYFVISDKLLATGFVFNHTIENSTDEMILAAKWCDITAPHFHNDKIEVAIK